MPKEANEQLGESREKVGQSSATDGAVPGVATKRTDRGRAAAIRRRSRLRWRRGTQPAAAMAARDTACSCDGGEGHNLQLWHGTAARHLCRGCPDEAVGGEAMSAEVVSGESREKESARQARQ